MVDGASAEALLDRLAADIRRLGRIALTEPDGKAILTAAGLTVPRGATISRNEPVEAIASSLGRPLALKAISPKLIHKSDHGAVRLNLGTLDELDRARAEINRSRIGAEIEAYLIEEMAPPGHEFIIGGLHDPQFGPVISIGLGGIFAELLSDISFRICPIDERDAHEMIGSLRAAALLEGARGTEKVPREAIVEALMCIGGRNGLLMECAKNIEELDINPLIVSRKGAVAVDARIIVSREKRMVAQWSGKPLDANAVLDTFKPLFEPRSVAVAGASAQGRNRANIFIEQILQYGYPREKLYAVHPTSSHIDTIPAYPTFDALPQCVDYAYVAVPAPAVPDLLRESAGRIHIAHVISSGFAETGRLNLQEDLVCAARAANIRVLGPNCNGAHSPRGKITLCFDGSPNVGNVGIALQSGGLSIDTIRRGSNRGLRFSGVISAGNCADVSIEDLLDYFLADPMTHVIGLYVEGTQDGRRLFDHLRDRDPFKPVVVLHGGTTRRGGRAAISHTGALASEARIWQALADQTGLLTVDTLDEFVDTLLILQCATLPTGGPTASAVLIGNGGGTSVLGVDALSRAGIDVRPFTATTVGKLCAVKLGAGASIVNPVDLPQPILIADQGRSLEKVLRIIMQEEQPQAIVLHANLSVVLRHHADGDDPMLNLINALERIKSSAFGKAHFLLVLRSDGNPELETARMRYRACAIASNIPAFDEIAPAARALSALARHERFVERNRS